MPSVEVELIEGSEAEGNYLGERVCFQLVGRSLHGVVVEQRPLPGRSGILTLRVQIDPDRPHLGPSDDGPSVLRVRSTSVERPEEP